MEGCTCPLALPCTALAKSLCTYFNVLPPLWDFCCFISVHQLLCLASCVSIRISSPTRNTKQVRYLRKKGFKSGNLLHRKINGQKEDAYMSPGFFIKGSNSQPGGQKNQERVPRSLGRGPTWRVLGDQRGQSSRCRGCQAGMERRSQKSSYC